MINLLSVFIGGGIGSVLRWLCCQLITNHWGTFVVNVSNVADHPATPATVQKGREIVLFSFIYKYLSWFECLI